jgi:hypothetical protein
MHAPRAYIHHTTATITFLKIHYRRRPMKEISVELGITPRKLYELVQREGMQKRNRKR